MPLAPLTYRAIALLFFSFCTCETSSGGCVIVQLCDRGFSMPSTLAIGFSKSLQQNCQHYRGSTGPVFGLLQGVLAPYQIDRTIAQALLKPNHAMHYRFTNLPNSRKYLRYSSEVAASQQLKTPCCVNTNFMCTVRTIHTHAHSLVREREWDADL